MVKRKISRSSSSNNNIATASSSCDSHPEAISGMHGLQETNRLRLTGKCSKHGA